MAGAALDPSALLPRPTLPIGSTGVGTGGRTYEILAIIERGGMGELFLARMIRPGLKPQYAVLKRLLADLLDDHKYVQMFNSEAQVMAELDHPNIVRVVDMPKIGGTQCLAMEYVRGRNVQQILARCMDLGTHIPPEIALGVMREVLAGLEYAHRYRLKDGSALQLVHRDVTPGNVLVSFDGEVKLTDFGIAKSRMSLVSTTVGIVKGKARYLSPEQILGEAATSKSDIFASAAVMSEMLTGMPAFDRGSVPKTLYAIVNGEMPDLARTLPFRAPQLVETIERALAPHPEQRTATAKAFADELEEAGRAFGPIATKAEIGVYLTRLFADVDDPLAEFFEDGEAETVHGPLPKPRLPSFPSNGLELSDVHYDEEPTNELEKAKRDAAESVFATIPPPIVKGTPLDPPKPSQAVDEALSVLAFLQSQSGERPRADTPSLKEIAKAAARVDDTRVTRPAAPAFPRPLDRRTLITFGAGAFAGVLLTMTLNAIFSSDPEIESEPEPEEDAELVLEAVDKVEEAAVTAPPPIAEPPPPPAAPKLGALDILYPRGARARIDGKLMQSRVPIRGIRLTPGSHSVRVWKGKYRRELRFESRAGGRYVLNQKLTKR